MNDHSPDIAERSKTAQRRWLFAFALAVAAWLTPLRVVILHSSSPLVVFLLALTSTILIRAFAHKARGAVTIAIGVLVIIATTLVKRMDGGLLTWIGYCVFVGIPLLMAATYLKSFGARPRSALLHVAIAAMIAVLTMPLSALAVMYLPWEEGL